MTELDRKNVQGFVIRGYRLPFAGYVYLRIDDAAQARAALAEFIPQVISAAQWTDKPESGVNVSFSFEGLRALGCADRSLDAFPPEFKAGMAARATVLGDIGDSAPERWEAPFRDRQAHVLVMLSAKDPSALAERDGRIRAAIERAGGASVIGDQAGAALEGGREHFGYADGFAQPSIEGSGFAPEPGAGAPDGDGWRPIKPGELLLGYPDEQGAITPAPPPDELGVNGSFLVYRKLHQDVAGFRRMLREGAANFPGGEELLAAKIVGRWRDGTPLDVADHAPDPAVVADPNRNNAFDYAKDPEGQRCPIGAHVRRMNPRRSLPFDGKLVNRHRIMRRGITYGDTLPEGAEDDGKDRGVIFMCLQASLARGFEFVQSQWANGGNAFRLAEDQDVIVGPHDTEGPAKMTVPGKPPFFLGPLSRVVTTRGGEYYFTPGINGLHHLANG
ncbi:MAG TPA: Dyp-type peroxidase [Solirubrobacteraceae bacterium]